MFSACKVTGNFSLDARICLLVDFLPGGKNISAACYIQILQKLWYALHKTPLLKRHIIFQHGNAQPHAVSLLLGTTLKYRCGVLPCPPYSPDLALLRLWPVWDLGKLDKGLALWKWCGNPRSHAYIVVECWTGLVSQYCIKSTYHYKKCKDSNGIFEKKWQNTNRTSSYWGQYLLSGIQFVFTHYKHVHYFHYRPCTSISLSYTKLLYQHHLTNLNL